MFIRLNAAAKFGLKGRQLQAWKGQPATLLVQACLATEHSQVIQSVAQLRAPQGGSLPLS
jgi:hypothetical protein